MSLAGEARAQAEEVVRLCVNGRRVAGDAEYAAQSIAARLEKVMDALGETALELQDIRYTLELLVAKRLGHVSGQAATAQQILAQTTEGSGCTEVQSALSLLHNVADATQLCQVDTTGAAVCLEVLAGRLSGIADAIGDERNRLALSPGGAVECAAGSGNALDAAAQNTAVWITDL